VKPTARAMKALGNPYRGVLYAGLMLTPEGPKLVEYNVRFGDPECQVLMRRLKSDLLEIVQAVADGTLDKVKAEWSSDPAITVVVAAKGYPGDVEKGSEIRNIEQADAVEGVTVFQAGTKDDNGKIVSWGGRVLNVTATGSTLKEARRRAYEAVDIIQWPEGFCRRDIGWRALKP
jgi:phosphoribosylamine--glycine ligase